MKIATNGNSAICEYEPCADPEFYLDADGVFFIHGYSIEFAGKPIGVAKRHVTPLLNYRVIGKYSEKLANNEIKEIIKLHHFDLENSVILRKTTPCL